MSWESPHDRHTEPHATAAGRRLRLLLQLQRTRLRVLLQLQVTPGTTGAADQLGEGPAR